MKVLAHHKRETVFAVLILLGIVLIAFWKLALMQGFIITDDIFASDIMNEGFPYRFSLTQSLQSGHLPLWVPEIYSGFPLLARAEAGICYPINIFLFGLFSPWTALNIVILLTILTAGVSTYLYLREIGGSFFSSLMSGAAFCLSGYLLSHLKHLSNVNAACWLPLGLFFIERSIRKNDYRNLLWLGIVFGLQHLAGHTQIAYYSGVLYIFYFLLRYFRHQSEINTKSSFINRWRIVFKDKLSRVFAGMLLLGSLVAAIQLIPTYELVSLSQRSGGVTFEYASDYAFDTKNLGMFLYPYINGDIGNGTYAGNSIFWEDYGYVGILTLLLALHASFRMWRRWHVKFFAVTALVSIILVLGPSTPVYQLVFDFVPGMKFFRFPTRFLLITDLSLVVLAGLGFTDFVERFFLKRLKQEEKQTGNFVRFFHPVEIALFLLVIIDLFYFQLRLNPVVDSGKWTNQPKSVAFIKKDTTCFRVFSLGGNESHIQTFQLAHGWEGDLQPFIDQREFIQPSSNILYGLSSPNGYANLTPNYIVDIWGDQNRRGLLYQTASIQNGKFSPLPVFWKLMNMGNVKYITSLWEIAPQAGVELLSKFGDALLYRNNNFMPRAYLVGNVSVASGNNEQLKTLISPEFIPARSAILSKMPMGFHPVDSVKGGATIVRYTPNEVDLNVETDREALLVLSDSYYPGWIAEVDGRESKIYQANVTGRAVIVPAGSHQVRFDFKPKTVFIGFWLTVIGTVCFAGLFIIAGRKFRKTNRA